MINSILSHVDDHLKRIRTGEILTWRTTRFRSKIRWKGNALQKVRGEILFSSDIMICSSVSDSPVRAETSTDVVSRWTPEDDESSWCRLDVVSSPPDSDFFSVIANCTWSDPSSFLLMISTSTSDPCRIEATAWGYIKHREKEWDVKEGERKTRSSCCFPFWFRSKSKKRRNKEKDKVTISRKESCDGSWKHRNLKRNLAQVFYPEYASILWYVYK